MSWRNTKHQSDLISAPILLIVFNRPVYTAQIMSQIAKAKPKRLYVAADGPRSRSEEALSRSVRQIATQVSWECEVKTLFRDRNIGCKLGVSGAIDWFFEHEEMGLIFEDDCIPSMSFFRYCDELLPLYEKHDTIGSIVGTSFLNSNSVPESYYFSRYPFCWGWATWARAWRNNDINMTDWPTLRKTDFLDRIGGRSWGFKRYWTDIFDRCYNGDIQTWDYQWYLSFWRQGYSSCAPRVNLVRNIGYDTNGTHHRSFNELYHGRASHDIVFPLNHPSSENQRSDIDILYDRAEHFARRSLHLWVQDNIPMGGASWAFLRSVYRKVRSADLG